jgi:hypothetical protein
MVLFITASQSQNVTTNLHFFYGSLGFLLSSCYLYSLDGEDFSNKSSTKKTVSSRSTRKLSPQQILQAIPILSFELINFAVVA